MSSLTIANAGVQHATLEATIIRANGTVEHLGAVSFYHRNAFVRWLGNLIISVKRKF